MVQLDAASEIFTTMVSKMPAAPVRELWFALKSELVRPDGGPRAMKEYLDSEATRLNQIIEQSIIKIDEA